MKAIITQIISNTCSIFDYESKQTLKAKIAGILRHQKTTNEKYQKVMSYKTKIEPSIIKHKPKVGDIVEYVLENNQALIKKIISRHNELSRPLVANIDKAFLVFSIFEPAFSPILLDTFLISLYQAQITPVIIISKIDLAPTKHLLALKELLNYYHQTLGINIYYSDKNTPPHFLLNEIKDNLCLFTGQTGVGKSTLINLLIPKLNTPTQAISKALGRGKHTTRITSLYHLNEGFIVDSPGFSKLAYNVKYKDELKNYYPDFTILGAGCKYNNCQHVNTPGCAVIKAVNGGQVPLSRYQNYLTFYEEIKNIKRKY